MLIEHPNGRTERAKKVFEQIAEKLEDLLTEQGFERSGTMSGFGWYFRTSYNGYEIEVSLMNRRIDEWHWNHNAFQICLRKEENYKARTSTYKVDEDGSFNETSFQKKLAQRMQELKETVGRLDQWKKSVKDQKESLLKLVGEGFEIDFGEKPSVSGKLGKNDIEVQQAKTGDTPKFVLTVSNLGKTQLHRLLSEIRSMVFQSHS